MNQVLNIAIVVLNGLGQAFWNYAAAMFVQASVLIVFILLVDFLLQKRVRAVFRYCLWMLVFIKLVLPTSLVLPTGIGYWLGDYWPSEPPVSVEIPTVEPSTPATVAPTIPTGEGFPAVPTTEPAPLPPRVEMAPAEIELEPISWRGVLFLGWIAGMLVFSALLVQRARFVKGLLAQGQEANGKLQDLLNQCRADVGVKKQIVLKLSANMVSPAVCGLFRATILLPRYRLQVLLSAVTVCRCLAHTDNIRQPAFYRVLVPPEPPEQQNPDRR